VAHYRKGHNVPTTVSATRNRYIFSSCLNSPIIQCQYDARKSMKLFLSHGPATAKLKSPSRDCIFGKYMHMSTSTDWRLRQNVSIVTSRQSWHRYASDTYLL